MRPLLPTALYDRYYYGSIFGIWDTAPSDQGSDMLGWAAYIFGSYLSHGMVAVSPKRLIGNVFVSDCSPNLKKTQGQTRLSLLYS